MDYSVYPGYEEFQNHVQFIINEVLDNCIEKPYKNKAIKIVGQMKNWSPLKYEGNGDSIVLELSFKLFQAIVGWTLFYSKGEENVYLEHKGFS